MRLEKEKLVDSDEEELDDESEDDDDVPDVIDYESEESNRPNIKTRATESAGPSRLRSNVNQEPNKKS